MTGPAGDRGQDRIRGFPAFPPANRRLSRFARSWWGNAWLQAMEDTALDPEQLRQGRRYAYAGHVGPITVSPGRIAAPVYGDDEPYQTVVLVEELTGVEWDRFLDQVAARAGHIAALLDRDMPQDLVAAAADAGVRLLPGVGDLEPECDCPGWELPCRHAAALSYQASWLLDEDPFVLLLMRGRGERELLDELQRRNVRLIGTPPTGAAAPAAAPAPAGTPAAEAYAAAAVPLPAPPPLPPPASPPPPALLMAEPAPGVDPAGLAVLVADAAARARELLAAGADPAAELELWPDTVRMAATHRDPRLYDRLRRASGRPAELARAVRAWECGAAAGLEVLEASWRPPKAELARARAELAAGWDGEEPPELAVWRNRWTLTGRGLQLRYGRDRRWYPYRQESADWWPAGEPRPDPVAALAELLGG